MWGIEQARELLAEAGFTDVEVLDSPRPQNGIFVCRGEERTSPTTPVPTEVDDLITALPKVELHVHLEGSMPPALLLELARKHRVPGLPESLAGGQEWMTLRDFAHFVTVYETSVQTLRTEEDFARLVEQAAAALAAQNVSYAEVIVSPEP